MKELRKQIKAISVQIRELEEQRDKLINENKELILDEICQKMDWNVYEDIEAFSLTYSNLERRIIVEVFLKWDKAARYVFAVGNLETNLRFRESLTY